MRKVMCADDAGSGGVLLKGATYIILQENPSYYVLKGIRGGWLKARFEAIPISRTTDPTTSKGKRRVNKYADAILQMLCLGAAMNGKELAEATGHPLNCITPRFAPLRRAGLIAPKTETIVGCESIVKRDKQIVWVRA